MEIEKQDLTQHSDQELSLIVFNTEFLYKMRRNSSALLRELKEFYIFSDEQVEVLVQDIKEDLGEA